MFLEMMIVRIFVSVFNNKNEIYSFKINTKSLIGLTKTVKEMNTEIK